MRHLPIGEVCTSTVKDNLEPGVNWPVCMRTFAAKEELLTMSCRQSAGCGCLFGTTYG